MPDDPRRLDVWCFGPRAGVLIEKPEGLTFDYSPEWRGAARPPLSNSLPLDGSYGARAVAAFFGGLLPEETPRRVLARRLGVSEGNDFSLLAALGGDTAGAITLLPPGEQPDEDITAAEVEWLDDARLAAVIDDLPSHPMHADQDGVYRLSLAGAQDKLPLVVGADGRVGLTKGRTPSTHILKMPIERLSDTVANEALCLGIGRKLGITTAEALPRRVEGREYLLVTRYDRAKLPAGLRRLHQEDFCQALGIPSDNKYERENGPGLADCFELVRTATSVPAADVVKLLDLVGLSFVVGNHDAHGKNYSLLYLPDAPKPTLAPGYDILSSFVYRDIENMDPKMAMAIGGEYRPQWVRSRHVDAMLRDAGIAPALGRRRLRRLAAAAPGAARAARAELAATGWDPPVFDKIVAIVDQRAAWMTSFATPHR